jgi:hypothetical protein
MIFSVIWNGCNTAWFFFGWWSRSKGFSLAGIVELGGICPYVFSNQHFINEQNLSNGLSGAEMNIKHFVWADSKLSELPSRPHSILRYIFLNVTPAFPIFRPVQVFGSLYIPQPVYWIAENFCGQCLKRAKEHD